MILIRKYSWALFLFLPFCGNGQCIYNGFDDNACGQTVLTTDGCPTWTNGTGGPPVPPDCGAGWRRSSGSPQMLPYTTPKGLTKYLAYMYVYNSSGAASGVTTGESMYYQLTAPNTFVANHTYTITFDVLGNGNLNNNTINFFAANNLTESGLVNTCGNPLPPTIPNQTQRIGLPFVIVNNNVFANSQTLTFVANANYNQIWIYPGTNDGTLFQMNIKYITVCENPCPTTIIYNTGVVPPGTSRAGNITAGTGVPGTATVTISPTQTTLLTADEVDLVANFDATVTTGSFTATTGGCAGFRPMKNPNREDYDPPFQSGQEFLNIQANSSPVKQNEIISVEHSGIRVYPSISTGIVNITGIKGASPIVSVFDQLGKRVLVDRNTLKSNVNRLDLSNLSNGLYYIQIKNSLGTVNKKVIICK